VCFLGQAWFFTAIPFGWSIDLTDTGPTFFTIKAPTINCAPQNAQNESQAKCPYCSNPISLATGNTFIVQNDVKLPGLGGGLSLTRTWNSQWPASQVASSVGLFGPNWRSTYEERIFMGADLYMKYARSDGSYWSFGLKSDDTFGFAAPANVAATLIQTASYLSLTFQNGEQRRFNLTTGVLTAIVDRNGNTTQLTYDSSNRLTTVTDPAGRHLYFNYGSPSSFLVTSVTSDFGVTLSYTYDGQGRLSQVTEPDTTTVSFTYDAQSRITQVTDSNGKVLEAHTYDSAGRGLTASQANGTNAVAITY
jgi:YD repeat-containing protein